MKEQALAIVAQAKNPNDKLNLLREYLQAFILRSLHESEAFSCLSFVGGTALRFLYNLPRFSEDLDFSLESRSDYKPGDWLKKLKRDMEFADFNVEVSWGEKAIVHKGWVKVSSLLNEVGLGQPSQKISVKIEVDTRPPPGALLEKKIVNRHFLFAIQHYDLPSMMAGKIHALCSRQYLKGRDWYDLLWYRSQRPPIQPNLQFLQKGINQMEKQPWLAFTWQERLLGQLQRLDLVGLVKDVEPFLERPDDKKLLTREFLAQIIKG